MLFLQIIIISYLIGCIPNAYLLVKFFKKQDITSMGTGNVGTLNTYESTKSKSLAIFTLILDLIKGIITLFIVDSIFGIHFNPNGQAYTLLTALSVIVGHNFNIFLKFKGGRGLATSAGLVLFINPQLLFYWTVCWLISKLIYKDILKANIISTIVSPFLLLFTFNSALNFLFPVSEFNYLMLSFSISIIILSAHKRRSPIPPKQ